MRTPPERARFGRWGDDVRPTDRLDAADRLECGYQVSHEEAAPEAERAPLPAVRGRARAAVDARRAPQVAEQHVRLLSTPLMPTAIVTGSGGLIGSEAARYFVEQGFDVVGIDNDMRS